MIDRLEEVLAGARPEEEQVLLEQLLRQSVMPAVQSAPQGTEESAQEEIFFQAAEQSELPAPFGERGNAPLTELIRRAVGQVFSPYGEGFDTAEAGSLYRSTVEALQSRPMAERHRAPWVIGEEQAANIGLSARELDRAVRRDSRRYDGGMNIY